MARATSGYLAPAALALAGALVLASCSSPQPQEVEQSAPEQSATTQSAPQSQVTETQSEAEEVDAVQSSDALPEPITDDYWQMTADADPGEGSETAAVITDLVAEAGDGYDRIVVEFTGEGPVGWHAAYSEQAIEQARGEVIDISGPAYLDLNITGTSIPLSDDDYAVYYEGGSVSVGDVTATLDSVFEGVTHIVVGMPQPRAFDIYMLFDPLRVVVDLEK